MRLSFLILLLVPLSAFADSNTEGVIAPFDPHDLVREASSVGSMATVLGCDAGTETSTIDRAGLSDEQTASLDVHRSTDRVLVDVTIDGHRQVFHADTDHPIRWAFNPNRIELLLPGHSEPATYHIDGKARYCPETRVLAATVITPTAASLVVQSTPESQQVAPGASAMLQIKLINNGTETLAPISVTSDPITTCSRNVASLAPGFSYTYTCTRTNVQSTIDNVVIATGSHAGGSVSGIAFSTITTTGTNPGPAFATYTVCRLPWVQYARPGELARWRIQIENGTSSIANNVTLTDPAAPTCTQTIAGIAVGNSSIYDCSVTIAAGAPPLQTFSLTTRSNHAGSGQVEDWRLTNGVITDYLHVDGMDGCVPNGPSTELCGATNSYRPMLRRAQ